MCIYGLLNGDRLQIRRAVNQASNGPHGARTMREAKRWVLLLRPVWLIKYWVHRSDGALKRVFDGVDDYNYENDDENVIRDGDPISPVLAALPRREDASRAVYHEQIKRASERNNDPSCGNT